MKGIILAGGLGTRLHPSTISTSKQLLPIYDKPLIYFPVTTLMSAGIDEILIISTQECIPLYQKLFGNGQKLGIEISYAIQDDPKGIAEAFIIGEEFIEKSHSILILGDNIFYGSDLTHQLTKINNCPDDGAKIFAYKVSDPERYGVVDFTEDLKVLSIEEKPLNPRSKFAVTGLYAYDPEASQLAKSLKPSHRGELEITDLNNLYLKENKLEVTLMSSTDAWLDAGTPDSLLEAAHFVQTIQNNQSIQIGCPEELALKQNFISKEKFENLVKLAPKNKYGDYLRSLLLEL
ncbi:glucose-1-phosphate thymidylyltransferase RfbA [Gammaproteobacteria bacterium]|jgi:glucose-1-phosphate thymidylyltransferase|nr:glucose-1-phosphate thymidylyltransferase RfbA [Gammaproteobacteria bacterium]|tara:strand:+ start:558 stop:1430 length:873 start_codon:yes stop_codon:yes gene_type:complete